VTWQTKRMPSLYQIYRTH